MRDPKIYQGRWLYEKRILFLFFVIIKSEDGWSDGPFSITRMFETKKHSKLDFNIVISKFAFFFLFNLGGKANHVG